MPSSPPTTCYCTNVHAGEDLATTIANLETISTDVRRRRGGDAPLGIGLWLSARAAAELDASGGARALRDRIESLGLFVATLNGFPFGDFHAERVKHAVYEPHWADRRRLDYTLALARILADLVPDGTSSASISTVPIGWRTTFDGEGCGCSLGLAASQLERLAHELEELESRTGTCIHVDLEPEPGCVLDTADDVVSFFSRFVRPESRRWIRVCHDVCHAAVMFESQAEALARWREAGIPIGKIQISSCPEVDFDALDDEERTPALAALRSLVETRYLHQTSVRERDGTQRFHEDLPIALAREETAGDHLPDGRWRVHFHVPIFAGRLDALSTTQREIDRCLDALEPGDHVDCFEVETYAWNVLPHCLYAGDLAAGIAEEMRWFEHHRAERFDARM